MTNYAHNQSCSYVIATSPHKVINITFIEFHLEGRVRSRFEIQVLKNKIKDWSKVQTPSRSTKQIHFFTCKKFQMAVFFGNLIEDLTEMRGWYSLVESEF